MVQARGMMSPTETLLLKEEAFLLYGLSLKHRTKPLDEYRHRKYSLHVQTAGSLSDSMSWTRLQIHRRCSCRCEDYFGLVVLDNSLEVAVRQRTFTYPKIFKLWLKMAKQSFQLLTYFSYYILVFYQAQQSVILNGIFSWYLVHKNPKTTTNKS